MYLHQNKIADIFIDKVRDMTLDQPHSLHISLNPRLLQNKVVAALIFHSLILLMIEGKFILSTEVPD